MEASGGEGGEEAPSSSSTPDPTPAAAQAAAAAAAAAAPSNPQPLQQQPPPSRYESQKRRDWNTFLQYLKNHKPPLSLGRCSGGHVIEFLKYLDQFGKTKVHVDVCPHFGHPNPPSPCACPLRQAWGSLIQPQPQQQQFQFQQQQAATAAQQQLLLYTADRSPAGYNTKWEDLHPDSQKFLLQIEQRIREYKDESERLDLCSRLYDSSVSNDSFELDASRIIQELGGTTTAMEREKVSIQGLASTVNDMMWSTEFAIRSYMMLRPRFVRPNIGTTTSSASPIGTAVASSHPSQLTVAPTFDFYNGFPKRPSPFMQHTAARFEKYLGECCKWIEELEQLVQMDTNKRSLDSLEALPKVLSNVHDYFVHVASKVESLHQYIESMKTAYLNNQRRRGDGNDPFLEANRREVAKQEAASRRVHPTLHLPATPQPTTQIAGAFPNSATSVPTPPQPSSGPSAATAGSGLSLFSTPSPAATSSFLFSTPTPSAPSSTLFGPSGFSPQSTPFGTASTSLFGSSQTPSGFGTSTPSFASTPAMGSSPLFSTPSLGAGIATGSGSSFGGASKSSRPKSRTTRR